MVFPRRLRPARSSGAEGSAASGDRSDPAGRGIGRAVDGSPEAFAEDRSESPGPLDKETSGSSDLFNKETSGSSDPFNKVTSGSSEPFNKVTSGSSDPFNKVTSGSSDPLDEETSGSSDPFATEALSYIDSLFGTAMRLTRRAADAEDLVQDTYLKAFRAADQFERGTNLKAWLFTILHNTFRNMRRHDGRNPVDVNSETVEQAVDLHGEQQSPEQLLTRATLDTDLQEALDALPDVFRQAVWLRDVEEFSYAEIASMLDVPIGTVMSRISRGRRMLFDRLSKTRAS